MKLSVAQKDGFWPGSPRIPLLKSIFWHGNHKQQRSNGAIMNVIQKHILKKGAHYQRKVV